MKGHSGIVWEYSTLLPSHGRSLCHNLRRGFTLRRCGLRRDGGYDMSTSSRMAPLNLVSPRSFSGRRP
ncbi:hypothetical protein BHE74_00018236 [Ensete ventricosum]|nr:hypothetical protein BHE74_00018236 [Ensete ventricosum]